SSSSRRMVPSLPSSYQVMRSSVWAAARPTASSTVMATASRVSERVSGLRFDVMDPPKGGRTDPALMSNQLASTDIRSSALLAGLWIRVEYTGDPHNGQSCAFTFSLSSTAETPLGRPAVERLLGRLLVSVN